MRYQPSPVARPRSRETYRWGTPLFIFRLEFGFVSHKNVGAFLSSQPTRTRVLSFGTQSSSLHCQRAMASQVGRIVVFPNSSSYYCTTCRTANLRPIAVDHSRIAILSLNYSQTSKTFADVSWRPLSGSTCPLSRTGGRSLPRSLSDLHLTCHFLWNLENRTMYVCTRIFRARPGWQLGWQSAQHGNACLRRHSAQSIRT